MRIDPFGLERWFAEYEHEADIMLVESGSVIGGGPASGGATGIDAEGGA